MKQASGFVENPEADGFLVKRGVFEGRATGLPKQPKNN